MARATFADFTDKYGFHDGATSEPRDYHVRDVLVDELNRHLKKTRAVAFDRPGMHNSCMIVFYNRRKGWKAEKYLADTSLWAETPAALRTAMEELPDDFDVEDTISAAYEDYWA